MIEWLIDFGQRLEILLYIFSTHALIKIAVNFQFCRNRQCVRFRRQRKPSDVHQTRISRPWSVYSRPRTRLQNSTARSIPTILFQPLIATKRIATVLKLLYQTCMAGICWKSVHHSRIQTPQLGANLPSLPLSYPPFPSPFPSPPFPPPPLEVGPLNTTRGSRSGAEPQRGLGAKPQRKSNLLHFGR